MFAKALRSTFVLPILAAAWLAPRPASALLEECGEIELDNEAQCEVQVEGGCDVVCDADNLTLACSGELYAECRRAECELDIDVECSASCEADCSADCEIKPGDFSCEGSCKANCSGNCEAQCKGSDNRAECTASCEATCSGECSGSCEGSPVEASCDAKCQASCEGQCRADANIECQVDCQAQGYLECKADLEIECEGQCRRPEGVVTCDGQFINAEDVGDCVGAIEAALNIEVEVTGSAEGECSGNECSGSAEGSVSCAVAPVAAAPLSGVNRLGLATGLLGGVLLLRRRKFLAR